METMICNKCGRQLDEIQGMFSSIDPEYGRLCIECRNNLWIEKYEKIKNDLEGFTKPKN